MWFSFHSFFSNHRLKNIDHSNKWFNNFLRHNIVNLKSFRSHFYCQWNANSINCSCTVSHFESRKVLSRINSSNFISNRCFSFSQIGKVDSSPRTQIQIICQSSKYNYCIYYRIVVINNKCPPILYYEENYAKNTSSLLFSLFESQDCQLLLVPQKSPSFGLYA